MFCPGESQGIEHAAKIFQITPVIMQQGKFMIDKTDVERRVMNNQVSAIDKGDKIINDAGKAGLIA